MMHDERITRRLGAGRKPDSNVVDSVDGRTTSILNSGQPNQQKRRRRVSTSKQSTFVMLKRQAVVFLRQKSDKVTGLAVTIISVVLLVLFILSSGHIASIVDTTSSSERKLLQKVLRLNPQLIAGQSKVQGSHTPYDVEFEILYRKRVNKMQSKSNQFVATPKKWKKFGATKQTPNYGKLTFDLLETPDAQRTIGHDDYLLTTNFRPPDRSEDDDLTSYYAFDDDYIKRAYGVAADDNAQDNSCRRVMIHRLHFPNCNTFHELPMIEHEVKYLNEGAFRQVVALSHSFGNERENFTIKDIHYTRVYDIEIFEYTRMDALVAERLTASKRIYNIYGHCGIGIASEFFPHGDIEDIAVPEEGYLTSKEIKEAEASSELITYNEFTPREKLELSLQMAESIADLHGYEYGVIVHQDVQLSQFLWTEDKSLLKLNDFNRAEVMLWDEEKQEYCTYGEGVGHGNWRSPEEYFNRNLNEKVDVFSLANNMYSVLTGLWVFYDEPDYGKVKVRVKKGEKAYIDPRYKERSVEEAKLADIIEQCHAFKPDDRPNVFEVVAFLRQALKEVTEVDEDPAKPSLRASIPK